MATEQAQFVIIIIDDVDSDIRELLHVAIKKLTEDWWHGLPNVWMVKGPDGALWWQERLEILFGLGGSLLVLDLPKRLSERGVGYLIRSTAKAGDWLDKVYCEWDSDPWAARPTIESSADDEPPF